VILVCATISVLQANQLHKSVGELTTICSLTKQSKTHLILFVRCVVFSLNKWKSSACRSNFSQNQDMTTVGSNLFIYPTKFYNGQTFFCEIRHPAFNTPNVTIILLNITCKLLRNYMWLVFVTVKSWFRTCALKVATSVQVVCCTNVSLYNVNRK